MSNVKLDLVTLLSSRASDAFCSVRLTRGTSEEELGSYANNNFSCQNLEPPAASAWENLGTPRRDNTTII